MMTIGIGCVTNFWQKLPKFGHDDNLNWSLDKFLVKITLVALPIFGKIYQK